MCSTLRELETSNPNPLVLNFPAQKWDDRDDWDDDPQLKSILSIYGYWSVPMKIPFLVGWTSINPSYVDVNKKGVQGLDTLPYLSVGASTTSLELILTHLHWTTFSGGQKFGTFRPHFEVKRKACVSSCCRKSVLPLGMADVKLLGWSTLWLTNIAMENPGKSTISSCFYGPWLPVRKAWKIARGYPATKNGMIHPNMQMNILCYMYRSYKYTWYHGIQYIYNYIYIYMNIQKNIFSEAPVPSFKVWRFWRWPAFVIIVSGWWAIHRKSFSSISSSFKYTNMGVFFRLVRCLLNLTPSSFRLVEW